MWEFTEIKKCENLSERPKSCPEVELKVYWRRVWLWVNTLLPKHHLTNPVFSSVSTFHVRLLARQWIVQTAWWLPISAYGAGPHGLKEAWQLPHFYTKVYNCTQGANNQHTNWYDISNTGFVNILTSCTRLTPLLWMVTTYMRYSPLDQNCYERQV